MADDSILIKVDADTKSANGKLDKLKKDLNDTSKSINDKRKENNGGINTRKGVYQDKTWPGNGDNSNVESVKTRVRDAMNSPKNKPIDNNSIGKEAPVTPYAFGKEAGKIFTAEFFSRMASKGVDVWATFNRDALGNNATELRLQTATAEGGISGALSGGVMGSMAGARLGASGGVWGAIIGAILGGGANALLSYASESKDVSDEQRQAEYGIHANTRSFFYSKRANEANIAGSVFDSIAPRSKKMEFYEEQLDKLMNGKEGIVALRAELFSLNNAGKQNTPKYKETEHLLNKRMSEYLAYDAKANALDLEMPFRKYDVSEMTDSLGKQGIFVGNQVDIGAYRTQEVDFLRELVTYTKDILTELSTKGVGLSKAEASTMPDEVITGTGK